MAVKLENRTRTIQVYNLTVALAPRRMVVARRDQNKKGETVLRDQRIMVPDSITFLAGETKSDLPDGILSAPEIKAAIQARQLKVVEYAPKAKSRPLPGAAALPDEAPKASTRVDAVAKPAAKKTTDR